MNRDIYELIEKMIDKKVKGADTYINNGSRWLIFTDEKKWIFELTKEGTLWYNYYFFQKIFKIISLDVVYNQQHITKWVENFIQNGVKHTDGCQIGTSTSIEDAIQNGVKHTNGIKPFLFIPVEDVIQNGVKKTKRGILAQEFSFEDTIQNGVKDTVPMLIQTDGNVEYTIQNGVKETKHNPFEDGLAMEEAIQNGIKVIKEISDSSLSSEIFKVKCKQTIRDGVKRTELGGKDRKIDEIKDIVENGVKETKMEEHHRLREVVQTVNNGIKNTVNHPARPQEVVDNIINSGIKETESIASHRTWKSEEVIQNGIKETTPGGYLGPVECRGKTVHQFETAKQLYYVEDVINDGIKETNPHFLEILNPINFEPAIKEMKRMNEVNIVLDEGIKEVKELPDKSGELRGYGDYYHRQEDRTKPHTQYVDDVLLDGIKETKYCELHSLMRADHIIRDGVKETWGYEKQPQRRVNEVINKGEKIILNNETTEL